MCISRCVQDPQRAGISWRDAKCETNRKARIWRRPCHFPALLKLVCLTQDRCWKHCRRCESAATCHRTTCSTLRASRRQVLLVACRCCCCCCRCCCSCCCCWQSLHQAQNVAKNANQRARALIVVQQYHARMQRVPRLSLVCVCCSFICWNFVLLRCLPLALKNQWVSSSDGSFTSLSSLSLSASMQVLFSFGGAEHAVFHC
jgi:hypothetical protein